MKYLTTLEMSYNQFDSNEINDFPIPFEHLSSWSILKLNSNNMYIDIFQRMVTQFNKQLETGNFRYFSVYFNIDSV